MIGGNVNEFLDRIYSCQDTIYIYNGIKYWFQGYMINHDTIHMEIIQYQPPNDKLIWSHDDIDIEHCRKAFIKAQIFNGKSFWEAEKDIEWVDD